MTTDTFETMWAKAQADNFTAMNAEKPKMPPVPTGTYQASIKNATLDLSKTPHQVSIWYSITEGEHTNRIVFANFSVNEIGTAILKKEMAKLGYTATPKSFEALQDALSAVVGKQVEVYAKHRTYPKKDGTLGDSHNVYINTVSGVTPTAKVDLTAPLDPSESLPF